MPTSNRACSTDANLRNPTAGQAKTLLTFLLFLLSKRMLKAQVLLERSQTHFQDHSKAMFGMNWFLPQILVVQFQYGCLSIGLSISHFHINLKTCILLFTRFKTLALFLFSFFSFRKTSLYSSNVYIHCVHFANNHQIAFFL